MLHSPAGRPANLEPRKGKSQKSLTSVAAKLGKVWSHFVVGPSPGTDGKALMLLENQSIIYLLLDQTHAIMSQISRLF